MTAVARGTARIQGKVGRVADTASVLVQQVPASLALSLPLDTTGVRESVQVAAPVRDSNQVTIPDASVTWTSLTPSLLSVDSTGRIRGMAEGMGTLEAVSGTLADTADVQVLLMILFAQETDTNEPDLMVAGRQYDGLRGLSQALRDQTGFDKGGINDAWSPDRSQIIVWSVALPGGSFGIMKADGSGLDTLQTDLSVAYAPDWSPDGSKIVYERVVDGNPDIFVMNADGSNAIDLTNTTTAESQPVWSPDGTLIAFTSVSNGQQDIYVVNVNVDGSGLAQVATTALNEQDVRWR
ncbi:MAG TPA: Ig-like domain-containing protein [Longimicrobiales bacterium]|nr:Ig-like domain-containing protein [Longimicrobiales bacterium]